MKTLQLDPKALVIQIQALPDFSVFALVRLGDRYYVHKNELVLFEDVSLVEIQRKFDEACFNLSKQAQ
jgi:hypothetical protein